MAGPLQVYDVVTGRGTRTQMKLSEDDAKLLNATLVQSKARRDVPNKMRTPANKATAKPVDKGDPDQQ